MKRWAQALHVARKDVRFTRWLLLAYGALAVMVAASWQLWFWPPLSYSVFAGGGLVLLGMIIAAVVVQDDSPARNDAFWQTRPLDPAAVFMAKLAYVGAALLAVALVAQAVALLGFGIGAGELARLLGGSALLYGALLALALLAASLTRGKRVR
jgi:ABC-type transport system involved in multi-copper enzyme maturation permease subunit